MPSNLTLNNVRITPYTYQINIITYAIQLEISQPATMFTVLVIKIRYKMYYLYYQLYIKSHFTARLLHVFTHIVVKVYYHEGV